MNFIKKSNVFILLAILCLSTGSYLYFGFLKSENNVNNNSEIANKFKKAHEEIIESNIISFAWEMNKESVLSNLSIFPEVRAEYIWENNKNLIIDIDKKNIEKNTDFIININNKAIDVKWNKLEKDIIQKFKVSWTAKIDFVSPEWEITDLTKNITVRFSKPISWLTTLDNQMECPIEISPKLEGKCVWITSSTFQFRPESGFPIGAKYDISIPSWIKTIAWDKTIEWKIFEVTTPKFELLSASNEWSKDIPLFIIFNAELELNNFIENFEMQNFQNNELDINYFEVDSEIEWEKIIKKNIISIFPKKTDWGYWKRYNYKLLWGLKWRRWNVNIWTITEKTLETKELITDYGTFIYKDENLENKELESNLRIAKNKNSITQNNPNILVEFYEEVELNKNIFNIKNNNKNISFDIKYAKKYEYKWGNKKIIEDKKKIILNINNNISGELSLTIKASEITDWEDSKLDFNTQNHNQILDYKFINYKKSCLVLKNEIWNSLINKEQFIFWDKNNLVHYISKISSWSRDESCIYEEWKHTYILQTSLNPETSYDLIIKKDLLDENNYPLDNWYKINFKTAKALNEDKYVSLIDKRSTILIPRDISPLGVAINTRNLHSVFVIVCEWDFDMWETGFMTDKNCKEQKVEINNLWFDTNISVLNLEEIFWTQFTKSIISLDVQKLEEDKTNYEQKYNNTKEIKYFRTNISLVLKAQEEWLVWLWDYRSWKNLTDQIEKIEVYESKTEYIKGKFIWYKYNFISNLDFTAMENGLYYIKSLSRGYLLFTLKSWEKLLLYVNNNFSSDTGKKAYITTNRPIYKPGDTVKIKWFARKQTAIGYELLNEKSDLRIVNSQWDELVKEKIELSENWSFEYEYILEDDTKLWNYSIRYMNQYFWFTVEEYEKPDFKIDINSKKEVYLYWETPNIEISADYYVGSALVNAEWSYAINAEEYNFYGGNTSGYIWWENNNLWRYWDYNNNSNTQQIEYNTEIILDSKWHKNLKIDTERTNKDSIYNISATITDPNTKKTISNNTSFTLLNSAVFIWMKLNKYYYQFWDSATIDFATVDTKGDKKWDINGIFRVYKVNYNLDKNTYETIKNEELIHEKNIKTNSQWNISLDYDIQDYWEIRFEVELENKKYKTTKTIYVSWSGLIQANNQEHKVRIIKNKEKYEIWDNAEFIIQSPSIWVKALVTVEKLDKILYKKVIDITSLNQKILIPIQKEYLPNFELKVFIVESSQYSPESIKKLKDLRIEMLALENKISSSEKNIIHPMYVSYDFVYKIWGNIPNNQNYNIKLLKELSKLKAKEQILMQDIIPNYLLGSIPVKVKLDSITLKSEATTNKEEYLPWDSTVIDLFITDNKGNPINWEAVVSVVDDSLLALKNNDKDIVDFFYSDIKNNVKTLYNLSNLIKRFEFKQESSKSTESNSDFWITTASLKSSSIWFSSSNAVSSWLSMSESTSSDSVWNQSNATKIRTEFKDSAYYNANVDIVDGKAQLTIPKLPDNLTTWVVKWYTITNNLSQIDGYKNISDTKVWNFETKFQVKKTLNLLPSIPRFFVSWDELEISSIIINNSDSSKKIKSNLEITNATILSKPDIITVPAQGQELLTWKIKVNPMNNDIDWKKYSSDILIKVESWEYKDSLQLNKKIIAYSTPEYTFTNSSTYDLSYEEKVFLPESVDQTQWQLDISMWATILTNLLDSIENIAEIPGDNFYSTIYSLKKWVLLKWIYENSWRAEEFKKIIISDWLWKEYLLEDIIVSKMKDFAQYQSRDGWMKYYKDCIQRSYRETCSNFNLTWDFLSLAKTMENNWYTIDQELVSKALNYYKNTLKNNINNYEENRSAQYKNTEKIDTKIEKNKYRNIDSFYKIMWYDNKFISEYVLSDRFINTDYNFDNISKLKLILLLQNIRSEAEYVSEIIWELKNKTIIEARGSFVPSDENGSNNIESTSLALKVFMNNFEWEKLLIENLARWILSQKNEKWDFGSSYHSAWVLEVISQYIEYTKELEDISFTWKWYLNYTEIIDDEFDDENKFSQKKQSYKLSDYINFWEENSLWFEKTWTWKLYYDVWLRYFLPIDKIETRDEWIILTRNYYNYLDYTSAFIKDCVNSIWFASYYDIWYSKNMFCTNKKIKNIESKKWWNKWDTLIWEIEITVTSDRNNVIINNFIPAWAEIINTNLNTASDEIKNLTWEDKNSWRTWFSHIETKDDRVVLFAEKLYKWSYKYTYAIKLNHKWVYHHRPAVAEELKKPEIWGRTSWEYFEIK